MDNKGVGFLAGFVIGALTGAVMALLFAPESGEQLRGEIETKGVALRDQAGQLYEDARGQMAQVQDQGRIVISENVRKAQQAVQDAQARMSKAEADAQAAGDAAA